MQRAKDTFYMTLRDGVAAVNPQRTIVVRGVPRPGVLVEENELPAPVPMADVFRLRWTEMLVDAAATVRMLKMRCELAYETAGTAGTGGMDRGRLLAAMDAELLGALTGETQSAAKMDFSGATPVPDGTRIFWSDPTFAGAVVQGERVSRIATVDVWSLEGAGEP